MTEPPDNALGINLRCGGDSNSLNAEPNICNNISVPSHQHSVFKQEQSNIFQKHWSGAGAYLKMIRYFSRFLFKEIPAFVFPSRLQVLCQRPLMLLVRVVEVEWIVMTMTSRLPK